MADNAQDIVANRARSRAMPMFGPGYLPPERKPRADTDNSGFRDVRRYREFVELQTTAAT